MIVRCFMKPIPIVKTGKTVEIGTHQSHETRYERSDTMAVQALAVIVESVVALELASAVLEKFGGDTLKDIKTTWQAFRKRCRKR